MQQFRDIVASYGTFCTIRRTMGADIASACGQLVQKTQEGPETSLNTGDPVAVDIEDIFVGGTVGRRGADPEPVRSAAPIEKPQSPSSFKCWLENVPSESLDQWVSVLEISAVVTAACFLASTAFLLKPTK
jgi:hypothetical protein